MGNWKIENRTNQYLRDKKKRKKGKEKTNSGYKHNNKVSHGIFNLTFRMLQHTSSEVTVTKSHPNTHLSLLTHLYKIHFIAVHSIRSQEFLASKWLSERRY